MKQILFFAIDSDLASIFDGIESEVALKYVEAGSFEGALSPPLSTGRAIPSLGIATADDAMGCSTYLAGTLDVRIRARSVVSRGVERFLVDQLENQDTVAITPGGRWGDSVAIHGRVATASETASSQDLMRRFARIIRKECVKIKAFWVAPNAAALLDGGGRLTGASQASPEYDLKR